MPSDILLANSPVSWGVDHIGRPNLPAWQQVFDEIAAAGYSYTELGALGFLPNDPSLIHSAMAERGLKVVGAALLEPLADPAVERTSLEAAARLGRLVAEAGGGFLVIVDWDLVARGNTAGRTQEARRLVGGELDHFHGMFEKIGEIARDLGLQAVAHPHGGTYLEFEDEIEALLGATDPDLVGLAIDTGHSLFAGVDPTALYQRQAARTHYVNFKDISAEVLARVRAEKLEFLRAVDAGVFCRLGEGAVDFDAFIDALRRQRYRGPAVVEQDRDLAVTGGDSLNDARGSLRFLQSKGLGDVGPADPGARAGTLLPDPTTRP